jgi:hypothetical protein
MHFMAAVTDADSAGRGASNDFRGALVTQNVQGVFQGQSRFVNEGAPQLGLSPRKQGLNKFFFHIQILVEEFAQDLLIEVVPQSHQGKLKKTRHRRWKHVKRLSVLFHVKENGPPSQVIQDLLSVGKVHFPGMARFFCGKGPDRQKRDLLGLFLTEKHFQDME